jgi:uncharacterized protein YlzI (FlbEa/FlbD family)
MEEAIMICVAAKPGIKLWDGKKYIVAELGQEIELPKSIARLEAKSGFVRLIGPKA